MYAYKTRTSYLGKNWIQKVQYKEKRKQREIASGSKWNHSHGIYYFELYQRLGSHGAQVIVYWDWNCRRCTHTQYIISLLFFFIKMPLKILEIDLRKRERHPNWIEHGMNPPLVTGTVISTDTHSTLSSSWSSSSSSRNRLTKPIIQMNKWMRVRESTSFFLFLYSNLLPQAHARVSLDQNRALYSFSSYFFLFFSIFCLPSDLLALAF